MKFMIFLIRIDGKEFVIFDNHNGISEQAIERVKFYHFLVPWARSKSKIKAIDFLERIHFVQY